MPVVPDPVAPPAAAPVAPAEPAAPAAAAAPAAPARPLPTQQATLVRMFGTPAARPATAPNRAAVAQAAEDSAELRRTAAIAAHALATRKPASSPSKGGKVLGWLDEDKTKAATNSRGVKKVVTLLRIEAVPLSYWQRDGGLTRCPTRHPHVFALGYFMLLNDGATRWSNGGKDAMCTNCFSLHRTPSSAEENLKAHLKSCNREWWQAAKDRVDASGSSGRHAKPKADDGTVLMSFDRRMELNMDCAVTFAALGNIPTSLVDNKLYTEHQRKVSNGEWVPPSSDFIESDGPALDIAEHLLVIEQKRVIQFAMAWYTGVACVHGSTDAWTARGGAPFLGTDLNLIAPWAASRSLTGVWTGGVRYHAATKLQHLQGSHNGERIALCITEGVERCGIVPSSEPVVIPSDNYNLQ